MIVTLVASLRPALRATREADAKVGNEWLPCIVGVPMPGERIGGKVFDGKMEAAVFPGDLPANPRDALKPDAAPAGLHFVRFRPPRLMPPGVDGESPPLPHIRLDRALDFLLEHRFIHKLESVNAFVGCHHPNEAHQVPFLICDVCAGAIEICDERVARLLGEQAREHGFKARAQTLEVHGVCEGCRDTPRQ